MLLTIKRPSIDIEQTLKSIDFLGFMAPFKSSKTHKISKIINGLFFKKFK